MRAKIPLFSKKLTKEAYKDLERFADLDRKAYETLFTPIDEKGHTLIYCREKQFKIYNRYHSDNNTVAVNRIKEAMFARCVDPDLTRRDIAYFSNTQHRQKDLRKKR